MVRLQKYLASCGLGSRRACEQLIGEGRVTINGAPAAAGAAVDPQRDAVAVDGTPVQPAEPVYILLNKPRGVLSSVQDAHGEETALDCLGDALSARVFPVGRLDRDVEGALLLTNDGGLAYQLTRPEVRLERVYIVSVRGIVSEDTAERIGAGIVVDEGATMRARVLPLHHGADTTVLRVTIEEAAGNRLKHLCSMVGHPIIEMRRVAEADVHVGELEPGEWRHLTGEEIDALRAAAAEAEHANHG